MQKKLKKRDIDYHSITKERDKKDRNIKQEKNNQINKNKEIEKK